MKKKVRGFTLPEVLVTVTVVAVLAAVVVPAVTQFVTKGNAPASKQDIQALQNGISGFTADVRAFPGALNQLSTAISASDSAAGTTIGPAFSTGQVASWKGPYFSTPVTVGGTFTSGGLQFSISDTIKQLNNWLQDSITTTTPNSCPGLLQLDTLLDNADGASSGSVVWTGTCAQNTATGTRDGMALRLTPISK